MLDWIEMTYLPHIKLLETHLVPFSRRSSTLSQLSKTPLLAPQFCIFQQVRLVSQVFGGLARKHERLFEPHSMFVRSLSLTDGDNKAENSRSHDSESPGREAEQIKISAFSFDKGIT